MADRAAERAAAQVVERTHPVEFENAESWLNGWPRFMDTDVFLRGSGVHCVGCDAFLGITSVVIDPDWVDPPEPDFPYTAETCSGWHAN